MNKVKDATSLMNPSYSLDITHVRWTIPFDANAKDVLRITGRKGALHCTLEEYTTSKDTAKINEFLNADPMARPIEVKFRLIGKLQDKAIDDAKQCCSTMRWAGVSLDREFKIELEYKHSMKANEWKSEAVHLRNRLVEIAREQGCNVSSAPKPPPGYVPRKFM